MLDLSTYKAKSGTLVRVWRIEIQTRPDDVDRLLDAIMKVNPLKYGRYRRNATVSGLGAETAQPEENSTTTSHSKGFQAGATETYPSVQMFVAIEPDEAELQKVLDAVVWAHHYEEPVIYVREEWASRSAYNPVSDNPNRWWNDGRGMPKKVKLGFDIE